MSKTLKILSRPKGNAEEYGRWSVNPYIGCSHGCLYCYLKNGPSGAYLGQDAPVLKKDVVNDEHAYHLAMAEIIEHREEIVKDGGLFMTFTSDPCAQETRDLFLRIINAVAIDQTCDNYVPCTVLTKNVDFLPYDCENEIDLYEERLKQVLPWVNYIGTCHPISRHNSYYNRFAIGFTLTGHDELEPNASPNAERIKAIQWLDDHGYRIWASIEPVIDFESSFQMIQQALDAGCQHFKIGLLTKNTKLCRDKYDVDECVDFINRVMVLTNSKATVYWKQSVRDFIRTCRKPAMTDQELDKVFYSWPNSVGKDYSMFTSNDYGK